ncbi:MAG TPA: succinate dehydrogenase, hydrophobic membrane anchor protein [Gammaproteobacteria bacterium]|nr:succinate dehydrogenase, hydrophobic membrane anchor protein [Gammaproteobacteria bacterium]
MNRAIHGLRSWLLQRLSAVYLLAYLVYFFMHLLLSPWTGYEQWHEWMQRLPVHIATLLFFVTLLLHAWIGVRDILMDYIHPFAWRLSMLVLVGTGLVSMGLWVVLIMASIDT